VRIIVTSGCFDRLHKGHLSFLRSLLKLLGPEDCLHVLIEPDEVLAKKRQSYQKLGIRIEQLQRVDDRIFVYVSHDADLVLELPQVVAYAKGVDRVDGGAYAKLAEQHGVPQIFVQHYDETHTTDLLQERAHAADRS
jgi:cytidyltransferase-like protein